MNRMRSSIKLVTGCVWRRCGGFVRPASMALVSVLALVLVLVLTLAAVVEVQAEEGAAAEVIIREVRVEGNAFVAAETIMSNVRSRAGAVFSEELVGEDSRRIIIMPQIHDVKWVAESVGDQVDIVFTVVESAQVGSVQIVGNKNIKTEKLLEELRFAEGDFLDVYLVGLGAESLEEYYNDKGYYFASIEVNEELLARDRKVAYVVVEGPKLRVRKVSFEGNDSVRAGKLKSKVSTKAYFPIFNKGRLDDDKLRQDVQAVAGYYHDRGFLDARVFARREFNEKRTRVKITFVVEEGLCYEVVGIRFEGNERFSDDELSEHVELEPGDRFTHKHRTAGAKSIDKVYGKEGYIYSQVDVEREFTEEEGKVIAVVRIKEDSPYRLGRVLIRGNYQTQGKVVRRDLDRVGFLPGGLYDMDAMRRGRRRLRGSGLFENLTITPIGEMPGERDALVEVVESHTGMIIFGVGVDTNSGVMGQFSVEQRNFDASRFPTSLKDLFSGQAFVGAGQRLRLDFEPGTEVTRGRLKFYEPYLFDRPYYLDLNLFLFRRWRESYLERRRGAIVTVGRRFDNDWSVELGVRTEVIGVSELDEGHVIPGDPTSGKIVTAPQDVQDVEGRSVLTSLKFGVGRDTTDSVFRPSEGYRFKNAWEQVGALSGDFSFSAVSSRMTLYHTVYEDITERRTVLASRAEGRTILGDAPVFERYYAGGIGTIRGFDYRGVSPRGGRDRDPIGSDYLFLLGTELTHPLFEETLYGKLFCDSGIVSDGPYRVTVGFGLELMIPQLFQMVPMHFDFGFPISSGDEDDEELFSFSFGLNF